MEYSDRDYRLQKCVCRPLGLGIQLDLWIYSKLLIRQLAAEKVSYQCEDI